MASLDDVRERALALPEVAEGTSFGNVAWKVKGRAFVWERPLRRADLEQLGTTAPRGTVVAFCVEDEGAKQALLATEPERLFTTPHFDGYPIVLLQLDLVDEALLQELVVDAWLAKAPKKLATAFLAGGGDPASG